MKLFTATIMLRGELFQQVPDKVVTAPEILMLQVIHGKTAVLGIVPVPAGYAALNDREKKMLGNKGAEERERLRLEYGRNPETKKPWADEVWPGSIVKMPDSLAEIGLDALSQANALEDAAKKMLEEAKRLKSEAKESPLDQVA